MHHGNLVDPAQPGREGHRHRVKPSASPGPAGGRSKLVPFNADRIADLVILFRWERPGADTGRIRLDHADKPVHPLCRHAATGT